MEIYGLIGKKLSHSFSSDYFSKKFERQQIKAKYKLFEIGHIDKVFDIINKNRGLKGFNITLPYKIDVIPLLDELSPSAAETGAVNTVKIEWPQGKLHLTGYNTDIVGFEESLKNALDGRQIENALILGTGGGARAVAYVMKKMKIPSLFVSRRSGDHTQLTYRSLNQEIIRKHQLIINTTPLGMHPEINHCPELPYHYLTSDHLLFDLVYNPLTTMFMRRGIENNAVAKNGLEMLRIQAEESWKIWQK